MRANVHLFRQVHKANYPFRDSPNGRKIRHRFSSPTASDPHNLSPMLTTSSPVSTGHLPPAERVRELVIEAHDRFKSINEGENADYIPALSTVPRDLFGICVVGTSGTAYTAGDTDYEFSIQSVSKPFVFALVCQAVGEDEAREKLGVNSTGLPFNSVIAIERASDGTTNPMVNAGAIAAASLAPGSTADAKWQFILEGLSEFAGRDLTLNKEVYMSEAAANQRNQGIANLLQSYGRIYFDPSRRPTSTPNSAR